MTAIELRPGDLAWYGDYGFFIFRIDSAGLTQIKIHFLAVGDSPQHTNYLYVLLYEDVTKYFNGELLLRRGKIIWSRSKR